jgi:hypothetical protein
MSLDECVKETRYLRFIDNTRPDQKTGLWHVRSVSSNLILGAISWYGPWRQYCFRPATTTVWNTTCLQDVQDFIAEQMRARNDARAKR